MADPGFLRRGKGAHPKVGVPNHYLAFISRKLCDNERNWTGQGRARVHGTPLGFANALYSLQAGPSVLF